LGTQSGNADNRFVCILKTSGRNNRFVCILKTSGRNKCYYDSLFGHKKQKVIGKWGKIKCAVPSFVFLPILKSRGVGGGAMGKT